MKQQLMKRILTLVMAGTMMMSMAACGNDADGGTDTQSGESETKEESQSGNESAAESESSEPEKEASGLDWLHPASIPMVDEGTEKKLSLYVCNSEGAGEAEDVWMYQFIENALNIDLEVTRFTEANMSEFLSLAFASNELPDIIIGGDFDAAMLVKYGMVEGQILDLSPYLNATYMPNLTSIYEKNPSYKSAIMDGEGHVWSLGFIMDVEYAGGISKIFLNYNWLDRCSKEVPETLDELMDVLYAFKELDANYIPMGGSYNDYNPMNYILNAFGYLTNEPKGTAIALRNGEVVLPVADREVYGEVLKLMKTLYDDGLIHPDFFTMDKEATSAVVQQELTGIITNSYLCKGEFYREFWGAIPLTSQWNDTARWPANPSMLSCGGAVVSAECENPELAASFLDYWYTFHTTKLQVVGPSVVEEGDYLYGKGGWLCDVPGDSSTVHYLDMEKEDCEYSGNGEYFLKEIQLWKNVIGTNLPDGSGTESGFYQDASPRDLSVYTEPYLSDLRFDEDVCMSVDYHYCDAPEFTLANYTTTEVYPGQVYLDAETAVEAGNLLVMLQEYAMKETAKFVTGARSLDEIDDYFNELESLGAKEYVQIYKDYYESTK